MICKRAKKWSDKDEDKTLMPAAEAPVAVASSNIIFIST